MKTISMVELRTHSGRVIRGLKRGERMLLSYRGVLLAELVPTDRLEKKPTPMEALDRAEKLTAENAEYASQAKAYLRQLRHDQKTWVERSSA